MDVRNVEHFFPPYSGSVMLKKQYLVEQKLCHDFIPLLFADEGSVPRSLPLSVHVSNYFISDYLLQVYLWQYGIYIFSSVINLDTNFKLLCSMHI